MSTSQSAPRNASPKQWPLLLAMLLAMSAARASDEADLVATNASPGAFPLCDATPAAIVVETNDWPGVIRAAGDLAEDVKSVAGKPPQIFHWQPVAENRAVIVGTLGKSRLIEQLIRAKKIDPAKIAGQWESYFLQVVPQPLPGMDSALVICGSDKRGTIYGIYDLSEHIGVSPWHYWADVPPPTPCQTLHPARNVRAGAAGGQIPRHFH